MALESLKEALESLKEALVLDNRKLNGAKQQVLGLARPVRKSWQSTGGTAVITAKDFGGSATMVMGTHLELDRQNEALQSTARPAQCKGGPRQAWCKIAGALLFGRCLHGADATTSRASSLLA